jgi:hypothetical protein
MTLDRICRLHGRPCDLDEPSKAIHPDHLANLLLFARLSLPDACADRDRRTFGNPTPEAAIEILGPDLQKTLERIAAHPLTREAPPPDASAGATTFQLPVRCPRHGWEAAPFLERRGQAEDTMEDLLVHVAARYADSCEHARMIVRHARRPPVPHGTAYAYARWMREWARTILDASRGGAQAMANGLGLATAPQERDR